MENVARKYRAAFVVNLSELGDNDPLAYNATANFPSLMKAPWYATVTSVEQGTDHYLKQIRLPHDQTLDIISLNTGLWENAYLSNKGCRNHYTHEGGILYIRNGSLKDQNCSVHAENDGHKFNRETCDGFHLHRVGTLEIESSSTLLVMFSPRPEFISGEEKICD